MVNPTKTCHHAAVVSNSETSIRASSDGQLYERLVRVHSRCDALCNRTRVPARSKIAEWYSRIALPRAFGVIRCPTIYGFDLVLDEQTGGSVYRFGFYEAGTLDVMQRVLRPGDVFVDAGASIGLMSLFASQCVGDGGCVLSFEPLPRRYSQLVESIGLNGRRNISAFPFGLGASAQDLSIFTDRVSPSMVPQAGSTRSESARVEALSDVLEREHVKSLRMIKIDVEGFELDVLQGCKSWLTGKEPPVICVEYGVYDGASARLLAFLRGLPGYRLYQLSGKKKYASKLDLVAPGQHFRSGDNIFCFPPGTSI